jgi:hypothetical protein
MARTPLALVLLGALLAPILLLLAQASGDPGKLLGVRAGAGDVPSVRTARTPGAATLRVGIDRRARELLVEASRARRPGPGKGKLVPITTTLFTIPSYRAKLSFDASTSQVTISLSFDVVSATGSLSSLLLEWLDQVSGAPTVTDGTNTLKVTDSGYYYTVALASPLSSGQQVTLTVDWSGKVSSNEYCEFSSTLSYNLLNAWLPIVIDGSALVYPKKSTLEVTVAKGIKVAGSGVSWAETDNGDGTMTYTLTETKYGRFNIGAGAYETGSTSYGSSQAINSYVRSASGAYASGWRKAMSDMLAFDEKLLGAYPWPKLDVIEISDTVFSYGIGGLAGLGCMFIPKSVLAYDPTKWTNLQTIAHETGHQWFAMAIHNIEPYFSPWLSEGMATFVELEYTSSLGTKLYGTDYRPTYRRLLNQAYTYRISSASDIALSSLDMQNPSQTQSLYITYYKGALVAEMIGYVLGGDTELAKALQGYVKDHLTVDTSVSELVASVKKATGTDLTSFMNAWVYAAGYPTYKAAVKRSGSGTSVTATVTVTADSDFGMPVELDLVTTDGKTTRKKVTMSGKTGALSIGPGPDLVEVVVDPDHQIVGRNGGALKGDVQVNGEVDGVDLVLTAFESGSAFIPADAGETDIFPEWADLNLDGAVDKTDLAVVEAAFGKKQQ